MKNLRKITSVLLALIMMISAIGVVSADKSFSDLNSGHWAYENVQRLVSDGTINGYADGTFKPNGMVTRAEFVKMIGKTTKAFSYEFTDVTQKHWAYDYIKYSDMEVVGTFFEPDIPITRNDVVNLIWKRAGSDKSCIAPSIITNQGTNKDACSWAYTYGIMKGDDGVTMRMNDGVTRAEAATLICRSRDVNASSKKYTLSENIDDKLIEKVYNSFEIFDTPYSVDKTFTNGEIAEAAMRIATNKTFVSYLNIPTERSVDREYTYSFYPICRYIYGFDKMTEEFYDAKATNFDTLSAFMFAFGYKVNKHVITYDLDKTYADAKGMGNDDQKKYIAAAFSNGIMLDGANLNPNATVTAKNLVLMLLQMDAIAGLNSNYIVTRTTNVGYDARLKTAIQSYPADSERFRYILNEIPNSVYAKPFIDADGKEVKISNPVKMFRVARDYNEQFRSFLQQLASETYEFGSDVKFTYYPSMVVETGKDYIMRVKVEILKANGKTFDDVFVATNKNTTPLKDGMKFYADISTGSKLMGLALPIDNMCFTQVVEMIN